MSRPMTGGRVTELPQNMAQRLRFIWVKENGPRTRRPRVRRTLRRWCAAPGAKMKPQV